MAEPRKFLPFETVTLLAAFAILALAGVVAMRTEEHRRESGALVRHTLHVESALHQLYGAISRAESDVRLNIITRDSNPSEPRDDLADRLDSDLSKIGALVADNPEQSERVAKTRPLLRERLGLLLRQLDAIRGGRIEDAVAIVRSGRESALMDQIDGLINEMIAQEESLYRSRQEQLTRATESLQKAIGAMTIAIAGVAAYALFLAQKQMSALQKSSDSLMAAYNQLIEESTRRGALEAQLRQSQKLEALGQLAGGIAHDFNNMLGVVVASLNILRRKIKKNDEGLEKLIDSGLDAAERAANVVRRLLAFSRAPDRKSVV